MQISATRRRVVKFAVGLAALGGFALAAPQDAGASSLCGYGRVWQNGSPTQVGGCVPIPVLTWDNPCDDVDATVGGTGVGASECVPLP